MARAEAVIVAAVRTPIGRYGGALQSVRPDDLSAIVMRALVARTDLDPSLIQDVFWGCANQAGEDNRNVGRMGALLAGFPQSVPATTINRLCGSSLDAVVHATRAIWSGDLNLLIAGGVESMSRAPYSIPKNFSGAFGNITAYDTALGWRYPNPNIEKLFPLESMGETAENIAEQYSIPRNAQDVFAFESHRRAVVARQSGYFRDEIVSVPIPRGKGDSTIFEHDEGPRTDTSVEKLSKLPAIFRKNGSVTAGNSSSLNDGASAVLIMSELRARELKLSPLARIVSSGVAGVDPRYMGIGPVPAVRQALQRAGLTMSEIDLIELNEAFAVQSLAVMHDLQIDPAKVNINGGAIALGHPLGCSGTRILTTLVHSMKRIRARYGLATMCIGVGQGIALIVERYD